MLTVRKNSVLRGIATCTLASMALGVMLTTVPVAYGKDKKKTADGPKAAPESALKKIYASLDLSKIVWPNPPAIARIRYLSYWAGEKYDDPSTGTQKKKSSWMERVAGVTTGETPQARPKWELVTPNGIAVDSKGRAYVADSKVRAIFIVDTETGKFDMIKNGTDARFQWPVGLAIDDADRLFVSDPGMKRVLVFDAQHKIEGSITQGLYAPGGLAVDDENRLLYVTDAEQDLVFVFDADPPYTLIRKLGKEGTKHASTVPGEFSKPTGVAVDQDGNVFVSDTWNDRIEVFDAEGNFIRAFGKPGDGPGYFARPKGIAVDGDGHVWVCDQVQGRVQVYSPEGRLLIWMGGAGQLPGQFQSLINIAIDKNNRVFTTEQYMARLQVFRYVTDAEAKTEKERRDAEMKKKIEEKRANVSAAATSTPEAPKQ